MEKVTNFIRKINNFAKGNFNILIWIIIPAYFISTQGWFKGIIWAIGILLFSFFIMVLPRHLFAKFKSTNIIKWIQYIGFTGFTISILFPKLIPFIIWRVLVYSSLFLIAWSILIRHTNPNNTIGKTLEQKLKNDFKLTSTTKIKKFPKLLRWVGGFVMPSIPFFLMLNKRWKKRLTKEAMIHEHVHLYYLQNGAIVVYTVAALLFVGFLRGLTQSNLIVYPSILLFLVSSMVFFEYITFNKTNQYGAKLGIRTRIWDSEICVRYFMVYSIQVAIIFAIYFSIRFLISKLF